MYKVKKNTNKPLSPKKKILTGVLDNLFDEQLATILDGWRGATADDIAAVIAKHPPEGSTEVQADDHTLPAHVPCEMSLLADGQKRAYAPTPFDQAGSSSKQSKPSPGGGSLNQQQQHALELAVSGVSIFLTGGAGTGKSFSMPHRAQIPA